MGRRLQAHEGAHDPYLVKVDALEGAVTAVRQDIEHGKAYAQQNSANLHVLRGQLDQVDFANRIRKLEDVEAINKVENQRLSQEVATLTARLQSAGGVVSNIADSVTALATAVNDIDVDGPVGAVGVRMGILENELNRQENNMLELASVTNKPNGLVHELARRGLGAS